MPRLLALLDGSAAVSLARRLLSQHVAGGLLHDLQVARAAEAAEADRQFCLCIDGYGLSAFPANEIGTDNSKLVFVDLAGEHALLELSGLHSGDPDLARFRPGDAEHVSSAEFVAAEYFSVHDAVRLDDADGAVPVIARTIGFVRQIIREPLLDGGDDVLD